MECCAVITFLVKKGTKPKQIFKEISMVLQDYAPSYTMVKNGLGYFVTCEGDLYPGRPVMVVTKELKS